MDSYAWVGKEIKKKLDKNGTISDEEILRLFDISFDVKKKFDNLKQVTNQAQNGQVKE